MNIKIDLPLIKVNGVIFEDETLLFQSKKLELWKTNISKISEHIKIVQDLFFQSEMVIDEKLLDQLGIDIETSTFELVKLLFKNLETVTNLQKYTNVRFDEIEADYESKIGGNRYSIGYDEYEVLYENELIDYAREFERNRINGLSIEEIIGDIDYISDYFDVINIDKFLEKIKDYAENNEIDISNCPNNTKDAIQWIVKQIDDSEIVFEIIENEELFNYDSYVDLTVTDINFAIDILNSFIGELEYSGTTIVNGIETAMVYIFKN